MVDSSYTCDQTLDMAHKLLDSPKIVGFTGIRRAPQAVRCRCASQTASDARRTGGRRPSDAVLRHRRHLTRAAGRQMPFCVTDGIRRAPQAVGCRSASQTASDARCRPSDAGPRLRRAQQPLTELEARGRPFHAADSSSRKVPADIGSLARWSAGLALAPLWCQCV